MAQSRSSFIGAVHTAMIDNSRYPVIAGQPMPSEMRDEMEDSMTRLADPIYSMVESFLFEPAILEPSYQVKTHVNDPLAGYLGAKIDDSTIKYNPITFKLYVASVPLATSLITGGVRIGAQPFLYMSSYNLMLNAETNSLLLGGNNMVPTSRAVKLYVDSVVLGLGGGSGGDMYKSTYDTNTNGVVDDSERLNNQIGSYYLSWANFTGTPTTLAGYGITDVYTETEINAFFEGEASGKKQVDWARITNPPNLYTVQNQGNNKVITSNDTGYDLQAEANLLFTGSLLTVTGDADITGTLAVDILQEYTTSYGIDVVDPIRFDKLDEYILDAGVTIESLKIEDGTLYTAIINMTFQDGTTGPHTLTQLAAMSGGDVTANAYTQYDLAVWDTGTKVLTDSGGNVTWGSNTFYIAGQSGVTNIEFGASASTINQFLVYADSNINFTTTMAAGSIVFGVVKNTAWVAFNSFLSIRGTTVPDAATSGYGRLYVDEADSDKLKFRTSTTIYDLTVNDMVYPGAGIALSTGSAWGTSITTLATLNSAISDATLIDTADSRLSDARTPLSHTLLSHTISGETLGHVLAADSATTYSIRQLLGSEISNDLSWLTGNQTITLSGDVSGTGTTAITTTIGANRVTLGMMAQIATARILGRVTASTGNVESLTGTQATTLLDQFATAATTKGVVPGSNSVGATYYLDGSGAWSVPAGSGDVKQEHNQIIR